MNVLTRSGWFGALFLHLCSSALISGWLPAMRAAGEPVPREYQVKAAFLLNFTKFVEWPTDGFADATSPIAICVAGEAPIEPVLRQMIEGESVNGRRIVMLKNPPAPSKSCQVLYVGNDQKEIPRLLSSLGRTTLTVGEVESFLADGGMINFVIDNRRVRFDINQKAIANSALKVSSKLLSIARRVENRTD